MRSSEATGRSVDAIKLAASARAASDALRELARLADQCIDEPTTAELPAARRRAWNWRAVAGLTTAVAALIGALVALAAFLWGKR